MTMRPIYRGGAYWCEGESARVDEFLAEVEAVWRKHGFSLEIEGEDYSCSIRPFNAEDLDDLTDAADFTETSTDQTPVVGAATTAIQQNVALCTLSSEAVRRLRESFPDTYLREHVTVTPAGALIECVFVAHIRTFVVKAEAEAMLAEFRTAWWDYAVGMFAFPVKLEVEYHKPSASPIAPLPPATGAELDALVAVLNDGDIVMCKALGVQAMNAPKMLNALTTLATQGRITYDRDTHRWRTP